MPARNPNADLAVARIEIAAAGLGAARAPRVERDETCPDAHPLNDLPERKCGDPRPHGGHEHRRLEGRLPLTTFWCPGFQVQR